MKTFTRRAVLERTIDTSVDIETRHDAYHPDAVLEFPQSGERFEGVANILPWQARYPEPVYVPASAGSPAQVNCGSESCRRATRAARGCLVSPSSSSTACASGGSGSTSLSRGSAGVAQPVALAHARRVEPGTTHGQATAAACSSSASDRPARLQRPFGQQHGRRSDDHHGRAHEVDPTDAEGRLSTTAARLSGSAAISAGSRIRLAASSAVIPRRSGSRPARSR